ncbi:PP2C family protein-serine/threonine phosphatase [Lacibacterium aquatile]|uniref:PP2C family protein-serine/threonine phosphatase n=1 Tax=Lacibacterium aquatile TaxID=1168082 RepID=A0ABW5DP96_9PROT
MSLPEDDLVERRTYAPGATILAEGDAADSFFLIERGEVEVTKTGPDGAHRLGRMGEGDIFGEMALIDDSPRSASVVALKPTVCRLFPRSILEESVKGSNGLVRNILNLFVRNLRHSTNLQVENRRLLRELTDFKDRLTDELDVARHMQMELAPPADEWGELGQRAGIDLSAVFEPSSEVGGDLWSAFPVGDHGVGLFLGDLTGHGVVAAVNAFRLHTLLGTLSHVADDPGVFLTALNQRLANILPLGQFAVAAYAVIQPGKPLAYAAAGWECALIHAPDGSETPLFGDGLPLGISSDESYRTSHFEFQPGAHLLIYSDALSEAYKGSERITDADLSATRSTALAAQQDVPGVWMAGLRDLGIRPLDDDLTIVCATRR